MRFVYSIVRFVPDPARGEFVNVGAIVGSEESSEWQYRQIENPTRARALDERQTLDAVWSFLDRVGRQIDDFERAGETLFDPGVELSEAWMERLYVDHRNVVQLSRPTPMVAASADEAMDRIFDDLVVDPARRRHSFQKKHAALAAVRAAYRAHSVEKTKNLRERVSLQTDHHRERFDFAVTNGKVVQLTHTWSFQVPDQEQLAEQVKAWGWTVRDVRRGGGQIGASTGETWDVAPNVDIEVVYVPPVFEERAPSLRDALAVFTDVGAQFHPIDGADLVAVRAHELLVEAVGGRIDLN
ncbi:MAG: DUF3037 domain-containing protein [Actinomycetota bacterium]|nr:DUF3037 domain-containing protein [Actinomycetota bacterium]